jgi:APA family basic amino acid/polyamine antiporter
MGSNRNYSSEGGERMPKLWSKKPIAALQAEAADIVTQEPMTPCRVPLKRTLSAMSLVALGIGNIIGAGIFVLTGQAAAAHAGPAIGLSFVISAIACTFAGLCYAELASSVPISGSAYTYA